MILDIILIVLILLGILIGYKKGFVKVIIRLGSFVLAILLAFLLQNSVATFIGERLGLENTISTAIETKLVEITENDQKEVNINILQKTIDSINDAASNEKEQQIKEWTNIITEFILKGISFIAILLVVEIIMGIISLILNSVVSLPVLKTLNGVLGAIIEVILVLFRIYIILAIISFLSPLELLDKVTDFINQTCITKWLYENNIIINIIGRKLI